MGVADVVGPGSPSTSLANTMVDHVDVKHDDLPRCLG